MSKLKRVCLFAATMFAASYGFMLLTPDPWFAGMSVVTAIIGTVSLFFILMELGE